MKQIDMQRLRACFPKNGTIILRYKAESPASLYMECIIRNPTLGTRYPMTYEFDFEQIKEWQRDIIGKETIAGFYTEVTGEHWFIYLKKIPIELINTTVEDIETYTAYTGHQ